MLSAFRAIRDTRAKQRAQHKKLVTSESKLRKELQWMTDHPHASAETRELVLNLLRGVYRQLANVQNMLAENMLETLDVPDPQYHEIVAAFKDGLVQCQDLQPHLDRQLQVSAWENDRDSLQQLLIRGADINKRFEGFTPLQIAAALGQAESVDVLFTNGADVDAKCDETSSTALHYACIRKGDVAASESIVRRLLRAGANETALTWARQTPGDLLGNRHLGTRLLLRQATERRIQRRLCVSVTILRNRTGNDAARVVRPTQRRRSMRLQDDKAVGAAVAVKAAVFLVHDAPDGVFETVMGFLGMICTPTAASFCVGMCCWCLTECQFGLLDSFFFSWSVWRSLASGVCFSRSFFVYA